MKAACLLACGGVKAFPVQHSGWGCAAKMHQIQARGTRNVQGVTIRPDPRPTIRVLIPRLPHAMDPDTKARLTELEIKLSFTEDLVDELNRAMARQQEQILLLQDELRAVFHQIRQMAPAEKADPREDIPPHY